MSRVKNVFRGQKGFTLIELLIVIVIIGILAAIAIPNIVDLTGTADKGAQTSNMRTLLTEIEAYRARNGDYPVAATDVPDIDSVALERIVEESDSTSYNPEAGDKGFEFTATFDFGDGPDELEINASDGFLDN